jgi:oxygen tolerance protein BatD
VKPGRGRTVTVACAWLLVSSSAAAAVGVQARLERGAISVGEATSLEVVVRGAPSGVGQPQFDVPPGVEVLSTGRAQNFTWVNGRSGVEIVYRYEISANAAGRYALGPIVVRAGQEMFRSGVLSLDVTAAPTRVGSGGGGSGAARLLVDVLPASPWQGQPCQLRVRLIQRAALAEDPQYSPPATPGFWTDKPSAPESYYADDAGRRVLVTETRTRLYPLAPGTATVGEAVARLVLAGDVRDPQAWSGGPKREVEVRSPPVGVPVRPLPGGAPAGFAGAVGALGVRWSADRARTSIDVPIIVRLDVRGEGNLPLIRPPALVAGDVEVFASSVEDSLPPGSRGAVGRKRFQWSVLARHTGRITIAAPAFAWFDPGSGTYHRAESAPIRLDVGPALFSGVGASAGWPAVFVRHPIDPGARGPEPWAWSLAGLMLGVAVALWRRSTAQGTVRAARALPLEWLRAVGRASGPDFWRAADEATAWLERQGRPVEKLRREIATARYAGAGGRAEAVRPRLVEHISSALPPAPATGALRVAAAALVLVAGVWCVLFGPHSGDSRQEAMLGAADRAAREGDASQARSQWTTLWETGARHPGLAARLAWLEAQSGQIGPSAAWVMRGEQAGGRDPALRWVAERVREGGGLVGDTPMRWPVRPLEWAVAALLCGGAAGAFWPSRARVATCVALALIAGSVDPIQARLVVGSRRAVVREAVTLQGAGLDLQPGQVVHVLERRGGRARVNAGEGTLGWLPDDAIDVVGARP